MEALKTQGIELPRLGFGTFRMPGGGCQPVVESALELGYRHIDTSTHRHIDTAEMYQNEEAVGAAIAASGLARKQLHLTTKVWHENLAPESLRRALDASLGKLGVDYVDLYMVHASHRRSASAQSMLIHRHPFNRTSDSRANRRRLRQSIFNSRETPSTCGAGYALSACTSHTFETLCNGSIASFGRCW